MTARRGRGAAPVTAAIALVVLSGCNSSDKHAKPVTRTVRLAPMPTGTASVHRDRHTGLASAHIELTGLQLRSRHGVTLARGTCAAPGKGIAAFRPLFASPAGLAVGTITSTAKVQSIPASAHLSVTAGAGATVADKEVIACADLHGAGAATLTPVRPVRATVTLVWKSGKLTAHVRASGLTAHTTHAVHVHFGSCAAQSGVEVALGDVSADAAGRVDSTTSVSGVKSPLTATGWYVDIHAGRGSSLVHGGKTTLQLRPLACGDASGPSPTHS